jgi:MarR family transcriptional regulator, negative regulator of the multidrug operon emrRAB
MAVEKVMDRTANLLGALALALSDAQMQAMEAAYGLGGSATAALVTLGGYPGLSVAALAAVVGLSHSATVRLVDNLERRGVVRRMPGADRRSVGLGLTAAGLGLRDTVMQARADVLVRSLAAVPPDDTKMLTQVLTRLLEDLTTSRTAADHICRHCDENACGRDDCPVERRAVALS